MTASEANRRRMLGSLNTEPEKILEQFRYIDLTSRAVGRGAPPISENRKLSFYDRRDRILLNDF
jgi:hypothetical protein